jgi:hypothetical protein
MNLAICRSIKTSRCHYPMNDRILQASACYFAPVRYLHERLKSRSGGYTPQCILYKLPAGQLFVYKKGGRSLSSQFGIIPGIRLQIARALRSYGFHKDALCCRGGISCLKSGSCRQWTRYHATNGLWVISRPVSPDELANSTQGTIGTHSAALCRRRSSYRPPS